MRRPKQPSKRTLARRLKEAQAAIEVGKQQAAHYKHEALTSEAKRKQQVAGLAGDLAEVRRRLEAMTDGIIRHPRCEVDVMEDRCMDTYRIDGLVRVYAQVSIRHLQGFRQYDRETLHTELANRLAEMIRQKVLTEINITP